MCVDLFLDPSPSITVETTVCRALSDVECLRRKGGKGFSFWPGDYFDISGCIIVSIIGEFTYSTGLNGSTVPFAWEGSGRRRGGERKIEERRASKQTFRCCDQFLEMNLFL